MTENPAALCPCVELVPLWEGAEYVRGCRSNRRLTCCTKSEYAKSEVFTRCLYYQPTAPKNPSEEF